MPLRTLNCQQNRRALAIVIALLFSFLSDIGFGAPNANAKGVSPAYGALLLHGVASGALDHTLGVLSPSMGARSASCASTLGAAIICLPFYAMKVVMVGGVHCITVANTEILYSLTRSIVFTLSRFRRYLRYPSWLAHNSSSRRRHDRLSTLLHRLANISPSRSFPRFYSRLCLALLHSLTFHHGPTWSFHLSYFTVSSVDAVCDARL